MKAVIYARYSSYAQSEQSIEGQLDECYEYARNHEIEVVNEYIDRAMTGKNDHRPSLQALLKASALRKFDVVLVYKLDRFARNRYDSAVNRQILNKNNVKLISVKENISNGPEGIILEGMLEAYNEYYSYELAQKVNRGMKKSFEKGLWTGGKPPLGYKVVDKVVSVDENTAPYIRKMFEMYIEGKAVEQIREYLKSQGYSYNSNTSIIKMLGNLRYVGINTYGEMQSTFPQIIDKETFQKAQNKIQSKRHYGGRAKAKVEYLLQGVAFCGNCGTALVGGYGTSRNGDKYEYYTCGKRKKTKSCNKKNERKYKLEDEVINLTVENVTNENSAKIIAKNLFILWNKELGSDKIAEMNKRITFLGKELDKTAEAYIDAPTVLRKRITEKADIIQSQIDELKKEIHDMETANRIPHTEEAIYKFIMSFAKGNRNDDNFRKRLINTFITAVYVYDDKIVITYNCNNDKTTSFKEIQDEANQFDETFNESPNETPCNNNKKVRIVNTFHHHKKPITMLSVFYYVFCVDSNHSECILHLYPPFKSQSELRSYFLFNND